MRISSLCLSAALLAAALWAPAARAQPCETPNMLIVLDRSGSMAEPKWSQAKNAIQYILDNYGNILRFGLDMYSSDGNCGAGNVQVQLGAGTAGAISSTLDSWDPTGMTPTAATLMVLNQYDALKDIHRRNFVMVVTDGCDTCAADHINDPVRAVQDLYANGIRTFVIGFSEGSGDCGEWDSILTAMATAGHSGSYYQADNQAELQAAMDSIVQAALVEVCDDRDNNCNGQIDESWPDKGTLCNLQQGGCTFPGVYVCNAAGDGLVCNAQIVTSPEVCDGRDNDCDGGTDEDFPDADADGWSNCLDCCDTGAEASPGCSPASRPQINPGATEVCNGWDDDCDGAVDESDPQLGAPCGATDVGECELGARLCLDGVLTCLGELTDQTEVCDGLDNDCDGQVDENAVPEICNDGLDNDCDGQIDSWDPDCGASCQPGQQELCGIDTGECVQGVRTCSPEGAWSECEGGVGPEAEVCDGRDNDCDGEVDEDAVPEVCDDGVDNDCDGLADSLDPDCGVCAPGDTRPCGFDEGECRAGLSTCSPAASWGPCEGGQDARPEMCDARDNDCDGLTDEGDLCEGYEICLCGSCAGPCAAGECQAGSYYCVNDWCVLDRCCGRACPAGQECDPDQGRCVDRCVTEGITCQPGEVCRMGLCVTLDCYHPDNACPAGELCVGGACQPDLCATAGCAADEYCVGGLCQQVACSDCGAGQVCVAGQCQDSACAGVDCPTGQVCEAGECAADPCQGVYCGPGEACVGGECAADPCENIACPAESHCAEGFCVADEPAPTDGGVDGADGADGADGTDGADASDGQDAGTDGGADGNTGDDSGPGGKEDCGCGSGGAGASSGGLLLLLGLACLLRRRS
ncbi:MAG TPA: MopE-related protein [Myxococcota bacterium]|nr:MopE-related protein [Myxococcota bacterium]HRY94734.1 MopE-related protein [Myxococcota bacterium]HSA20043.1 MopE-related protein [Myxococcota bacterium]